MFPLIRCCSRKWLATAVLFWLLPATLLGCEEKVSLPPVLKSGVEVRCSVDLGLTEENAVVRDWSGESRRWESRVDGDLVIISARGICGDECGFTYELVLSGLSDECPTFHSGRVRRSAGGSPAGSSRDTTWATQGVLEIQDWDPERAISGRLDSEVDFTFYAN